MKSVTTCLFIYLLRAGAANWIDVISNPNRDCRVTAWDNWSDPYEGEDGKEYVERKRYVIQQSKGEGKPCPVLIQIALQSEIDAERFVDNIVKTYKPRDVVIVMDSSGSISDDEFYKTRNNIATLVMHLCPGPGNIGFNINQYVVAFALFDTKYQQVFDFSASFNRTVVQNKILSLKRRTRGRTSTARALRSVRNMLTSPNYGTRSSSVSDKLVLLITDGNSNGPFDLGAEAENLKLAQYAQIYAIGIGNVNQAELNKITSGHKDHTFHYAQWSNFHEMVSKVEEETNKFQEPDCAPIF